MVLVTIPNCNQVTTKIQLLATVTYNYKCIETKLNIMKVKPGLGVVCTTITTMHVIFGSDLFYSSQGLHGAHFA